VVAASGALHQALADFTPNKAATVGGGGPGDAGLGALVAAENHLATASCPELGAELETAKGAAKASVDKALAGLTGANQRAAVAKVVAAAQADGQLSDAEARYLTPAEQLALLRSSTAATEAAGVKELAASRAEQLGKLQAAKALCMLHGGPGSPGPLALSNLDTAEGKESAAAFAGVAGDYFAARTQVASWAQIPPSQSDGPRGRRTDRKRNLPRAAVNLGRRKRSGAAEKYVRRGSHRQHGDGHHVGIFSSSSACLQLGLASFRSRRD
ncbi:MAG: hypothetical protein LC808_26005, partial [Actinobacteria bacterium]|nr:hypothetical protein [Actinomycetota bacterium]